ncbi:hypothetical protein PPTG_02281 [Phytophthora nicotianae INRA-310]|uniref:Transmembrane protein n=4 Tax=Phytophthora nicotianae TaxID=4792 RepID=W2RCD4_PHYN3|nr:hypothetical protein PPTG_02281 [Phytophthora nicotianae INRA-310]ETI50237.1 hypothetical protein F443_06148 [Phytophthora nicotianae P1569]ETL43518.1 hypothetical protein L916_05962 [Phytophthora nicotianae]KUF82703.1 hypothetical protein AM587_10013256 [Phytophthora nicotianae]ETM49850.1 hypothetical protein L914_05967 [Phytophthora nicotianae]ETN22314.1 hypothetical protein PPTG_02281 [Phytophthora nicotianae INRA-310]
MGALAQVWHGSVALLAWTFKLIRTPHTSSLPSAVSSSSARSNVWSFLTAGPRRARRQSHAALELLEKFRHGPETHSEWNLFLWRATFPLVSLVLLTLLCVAGQFGHTAYSLLVNPVWYFCNLALVTTPFLLVFRFSGLEAVDGEPQTKIWYGLAAISFAISLVEWYMSLPASRYSWIVGNTLFGMVALGAVPLFFSMQPRTARSQYDDLVLEQEQDRMRGVPEEDEDVDIDGDIRRLARQRSSDRLRELEMQRQGQPKMTRLLYGCGFCALVLWLIMFSSYSSARGSEPATQSWFLLYSLSPVLCIALFCARVARVRFSFEHAVAYSTLVVHVPLFLGHLCVRLFALAEDPAASSPTSSESWLKLAISVLYLLLMQGYFFVITHTVNSMSEPFAHPSLLYIGQLYYYTFWYCLVGSDTPIDALYWGMLLLNNIHIAFLNTGVYTDFKRTSSAWLAIPLHSNITSSVAFCLRTTTSVMDVSRCLPHRRSWGRRGLLGLNCGVVGAAAMDTESDLLEGGDDDYEYDNGYGSDGFVVTRNIDDKEPVIGELPSWQETGSRNRERDRGVSENRRDTQSLPDFSSPARKSGTKKTSSLRDKCSRAQMNCRKCGDGTKSSRSGNENVAFATSATNSESRTATSDALRPLYFLMKVAEQDNMADTTALILVPSLLTLLAVFEKPGSALAVLQDQTNLWLRCVCMFIGRLGGSFLAREIFTCKLRSRLRSSPEDLGDQPDPISGSIDGMSARLWIQQLMLQDFHAQFWYLTAVTVVVIFGCFARIDLPLRFALL